MGEWFPGQRPLELASRMVAVRYRGVGQKSYLLAFLDVTMVYFDNPATIGESDIRLSFLDSDSRETPDKIKSDLIFSVYVSIR